MKYRFEFELMTTIPFEWYIKISSKIDNRKSEICPGKNHCEHKYFVAFFESRNNQLF